MFYSRKLTRRTLLEGFGAMVATAPFLGRIPSAHAQTVPTRFIAFLVSNDNISKSLWDPGVSSGAALPARLPAYFEPASPFKDRIAMLSDIEASFSAGGSHETWGVALAIENTVSEGSGEDRVFYGGGPTFDQALAERHNQAPLVLGFRGTHRRPLRNFSSWAGRRQPNTPYNNPRAAFEQVFGTASANDPAEARRIAQRRSVLDAIAGEVQAVERRLPTSDRYIFEAHLDGIRDLERRLSEVMTTGCERPTAPEDGWDPTANANFPRMCRLSTEVAVAAMRCDLRRSIVLQYGSAAGDGLRGSWPDEGVRAGDRLHTMAHHYYGPGQDETASAAQREQWKRERMDLELFHGRLFADLLEKMDAVSETGGTMLDNSLVLWTRGMGHGHRQDQRVFLLAGGAGGRLETNKYRSFEGKEQVDLLATCAHLVGHGDLVDRAPLGVMA